VRCITPSTKEGRGNKNDESDVHLPQRWKKSGYLITYFIFIFIFIVIFIFYRFLFEALFSKKSIWVITKNAFFFLRFFSSSSVVLLDFFLSRFWAFRNKGSWEFKNAIKKSHENLLSFQKKYLLT
jgi:hypothetical protein